MDNKPLVSIIIPIYGVEEFLHQCIDSVLGQTYHNIEVILVDDGSKDRCPQICNEYAKRDNRVKVIHKENGGPVSARKQGILMARGEFVQFVDGDDWLASSMTEHLINCALKYDVGMVECSFYFSGKENEKYNPYFAEGYYDEIEIAEKIIPRMMFTGKYFEIGIYPTLWNKLFKRQDIFQYIIDVPDTITLGDDAASVYPFLLSVKSIYITHKYLYYYRENTYGITKSFHLNQTHNTIDLILYLRKRFEEKKDKWFNIMQQLDYYLFFMTENNLVNNARAGFSNHFIRRWKEMHYFIQETELRKAVKRQNMKVLGMKSRILVVLSGYSLVDMVLFYQAVTHPIVNNIKLKKRSG